MSGLEVAGIVLGAFPLAIQALDKYREVSKRCGFWYKIRLEYQKCSDHLTYYRLAYRRHLKLLLLPLVVDDGTIQELLADPGAEGWKDAAVAKLLEGRLDESYELYMRHITAIEEVMERLNHELAVDEDAVQQPLTTVKGPMKPRIKHAMTKDGVTYHLYKLKFSNGATIRNELFAELKDLLDRMRDLLDTSDKETKLVRQRAAAARSSAIDSAICNFWIRANKLFRALASAWNCCCSCGPPQHHQQQLAQQTHCARLLLQHRTCKGDGEKSQFEMLFARALGDGGKWDVRRTKIVEGDNNPTVMPVEMTEKKLVNVGVPRHRQKQPVKSALRTTRQASTLTISKTALAITLTATSKAHPGSDVQPITNLCISLGKGKEPCCGFLPEEDCRYYVYRLAHEQTQAFSLITLDEMLRGDVQPPPTRRQRYALSLILASSFLQLLETPWLPATWSKSDIVFVRSATCPGAFALDEPHLNRGLTAHEPVDTVDKNNSTAAAAAVTATTVHQSLDLLGIVLLELCFGTLLEAHPSRKRWPHGNTDTERTAFDFMAAREWQLEVNEEAGPDYADAAAWCLGGNRSTPPELWRREMLQKVVQPLERCRQYLG